MVSPSSKGFPSACFRLISQIETALTETSTVASCRTRRAGLLSRWGGIDQPEESTCVEKQRQVPRNCDSLISQSSAIAMRALPANNPSGRLVPLVGTGETIATAFFLRPKVTVIDSPLRTASKASEKRLLNSPTLIVFTAGD